jgi:hypothetical protein
MKKEGAMKILKSLFLLFCVFFSLVFVNNVSAVTDDIIDDFLSTAGLACGDTSTMPSPKSDTNVVWADVDGDGTYDTQVVFTTLGGYAEPAAEFAPATGKWYYFSPIDSS